MLTDVAQALHSWIVHNDMLHAPPKVILQFDNAFLARKARFALEAEFSSLSPIQMHPTMHLNCPVSIYGIEFEFLP